MGEPILGLRKRKELGNCLPPSRPARKRDHARDEIAKFRARKKKKTRKNINNRKKKKTRKNINNLNWDDLPKASQECILLQQRTMTSVSASDATSVTSTITGTTSSKRGSITLLQDVVVLASGPTSKLPIPVAIHSPMAHNLTLLTGCMNEERDCPNLRCFLDSCAALTTSQNCRPSHLPYDPKCRN